MGSAGPFMGKICASEGVQILVTGRDKHSWYMETLTSSAGLSLGKGFQNMRLGGRIGEQRMQSFSWS